MSSRNNPLPKRTREEKEEEFLQGLEQLLGFPLMAAQRPVIIEMVRNVQSGTPIDFSAIRRARRDV